MLGKESKKVTWDWDRDGLGKRIWTGNGLGMGGLCMRKNGDSNGNGNEDMEWGQEWYRNEDKSGMGMRIWDAGRSGMGIKTWNGDTSGMGMRIWNGDRGSMGMRIWNGEDMRIWNGDRSGMGMRTRIWNRDADGVVQK